MIDQKHRSIYFRLLVLTNELQQPLKKLGDRLKLLEQEKNKTDNCYEKMREMTGYLNSSSLLCKKLIEWSEAHLLGDTIYSAHIKFQANLIMKILSSTPDGQAMIISDIEDLRGAKINLNLFGFMLHRLLTIILRFSSSEKLLLSSSCKDEELIICVSGIKPSTYQSMGEELLLNSGTSSYRPEADLFRLCYEILHFYGGNLWSESCGKSGGKLYFSIPVIKNI